MARLFSGLLGTVLVLTASCNKVPEGAASKVVSTEPSTNQQVFQARGMVVEVKPRERQVEIKHEAIPGYMPAMTMPFDVKGTNDLAGLEPGQVISFRLIVTKTEGWIDQIQKLAPPTAKAPPGATTIGETTNIPLESLHEAEPLNPGDVLPEYHFIDQFGQPFSTRAFKGQALAITFLFTRCPFPNFCPRVATEFSEVQQKLLAMANGPTNWHLLTISFDPEFDKPEVLKAYSQAFECEPGHWTFATGKLEEITRIGDQLGLAFWKDETGSISHNLRTAVVDAAGKVQKIFQGNQWTSEELVTEMVKVAGPEGLHR
ncbi:MAG TPA: SCO family protein [Candidatus Binatia bacterium]|jgi:protein SCO1/2|nr:SCO family protein [Candidatus Binatia bacterium]